MGSTKSARAPFNFTEAFGTHGFTAVALVISALIFAGCSLFQPTAEYRGQKRTAEGIQAEAQRAISTIDARRDKLAAEWAALDAEADDEAAAAQEAVEIIKRKVEERNRILGGVMSLAGLLGAPAPVTELVGPLLMSGAVIDTIRVRRRQRSTSAAVGIAPGSPGGEGAR